MISRHILVYFKFKVFPTDATIFFMDFFSKIKTQPEEAQIRRNDLTDLLMDLWGKTKISSGVGGDDGMAPLTLHEFVAQMHVFFEASFETTGGIQTFALYDLAANP